MNAKAVIGVDGGGTHTRVLVLDATGGELARAEGGPALIDKPDLPIDIETVASTVRHAASDGRVELPVAALCVGLAGVGREPERLAVETALDRLQLARAVRVVTDAEAAFHDAFGAGPGLLLISGTGSVAMGRAEDGREARAGGWGQVLGDEGSGYDIGVRALQDVARASDRRGPQTLLEERLCDRLELSAADELIRWAAGAAKIAVAELAPLVCEVAAEGDEVANAIVASAVAALQAHVDALLSQLGPWPSPPGLALAGGLLDPGGPLRDAVIAAVSSRDCVPLERTVDAVSGAARMALDVLSG